MNKPTREYTITAAGAVQGTYPGTTEEEAIQAYARDAGYATMADLAATLGISEEEARCELVVEEGPTPGAGDERPCPGFDARGCLHTGSGCRVVYNEGEICDTCRHRQEVEAEEAEAIEAYADHRYDAEQFRIRTLADEAAAVGDEAQEALCDAALAGDQAARAACLQALADAEAQDDE